MVHNGWAHHHNFYSQSSPSLVFLVPMPRTFTQRPMLPVKSLVSGLISTMFWRRSLRQRLSNMWFCSLPPRNSNPSSRRLWSTRLSILSLNNSSVCNFVIRYHPTYTRPFSFFCCFALAHMSFQQSPDSLFKNKQVKFLASIVPKFRAMYEQESGVTNLNITLAEVPTKGDLVDTLKRLESIDLFNESQTLKLTLTVSDSLSLQLPLLLLRLTHSSLSVFHNQIDPEILGGLQASTDTRRVDWSDKSRYDAFKKKLDQAGKKSLAAYRARVMDDFPQTWEELPFKNWVTWTTAVRHLFFSLHLQTIPTTEHNNFLQPPASQPFLSFPSFLCLDIFFSFEWSEKMRIADPGERERERQRWFGDWNGGGSRQ